MLMIGHFIYYNRNSGYQTYLSLTTNNLSRFTLNCMEVVTRLYLIKTLRLYTPFELMNVISYLSLVVLDFS